MICARAWPTGATRQKNPFPPFFARVFKPTQMQHLCIVAAAKLGWEYMLTQHADTRRTGHTTYLILSAVAPGFLSDLQRGRQDKWLHATCYNTLRVVYLDKQTQMWILVQYEQQTQDL